MALDFAAILVARPMQAGTLGRPHYTSGEYWAVMRTTGPIADPAALVCAWSRGLASLSPGQPPCPGFRLDDWATSLENCRRFVDEFGAEAARLGSAGTRSPCSRCTRRPASSGATAAA
ncbi:hypothetical protein [Methylobacterium sp. WSM2598]|uniref:hypothetical protein n=1 Tax=Methylobacterium sp. WSM2598 TaxID=398261 RepID=UPI0003AA2319|nr:hypothetical protein [Methylobacterium sp. WSM2598]